MCTVLRSTFQCPRNLFDDNNKKESSARYLQMDRDFGQQLLICVRIILETARASDISRTRNKFNGATLPDLLLLTLFSFEFG